MYKSLFILFFCFHTFYSVNAQQIEAFSGVNYAKFFGDASNEYPYFKKYNKLEQGLTVGIAIDSVKVDWLRWRFEIVYNQYSGGFYQRTSGHGGDFETQAEIKKATLGLVFYPIQFNVFKRVRMNVGFSYSFLVSESFSGYTYSQIYLPYPPPPATYTNIEDKYSRLSDDRIVGIQTSIAYPILLNENWVIRPQCSFNVGIDREFRYLVNAYSLRYFIGVGLSRNLRK
jgi:hypothetical protein